MALQHCLPQQVFLAHFVIFGALNFWAKKLVHDSLHFTREKIIEICVDRNPILRNQKIQILLKQGCNLPGNMLVEGFLTSLCLLLWPNSGKVL